MLYIFVPINTYLMQTKSINITTCLPKALLLYTHTHTHTHTITPYYSNLFLKQATVLWHLRVWPKGIYILFLNSSDQCLSFICKGLTAVRLFLNICVQLITVTRHVLSALRQLLDMSLRFLAATIHILFATRQVMNISVQLMTAIRQFLSATLQLLNTSVHGLPKSRFLRSK